MSKIIAVNAGPRKGWNTETLIDEASKGAESAGAVVERYNLFELERYTGCISCFGCKKESSRGTVSAGMDLPLYWMRSGRLTASSSAHPII